MRLTGTWKREAPCEERPLQGRVRSPGDELGFSPRSLVPHRGASLFRAPVGEGHDVQSCRKAIQNHQRFSA
jgi:hypothetical protein